MSGESGFVGTKSPRLSAKSAADDCLGYHAVCAQAVENRTLEACEDGKTGIGMQRIPVPRDHPIKQRLLWQCV